MLISILFCVIWFEFLQMPRRHVALQRKPFNCEICLPIYVAIVAYFIPSAWQDFIVAVMGACVAVPLILKLIRQWN